MNEKVPGIWKWTVILLLICNVCLILTVWFLPKGPKGQQPGGPRDYVIHELKFTDEQVKKYDALIKDHQEAMHKLRDEAKGYREQLFSNLKNGAASPDSLAQLIANNQKQVEVVTYNHFAQVRALCTDAQKTDFDKIIGDVVKKMNGPGHGGPPPRDGQHHDGPPPPADGPPPPPPDGR